MSRFNDIENPFPVYLKEGSLQNEAKFWFPANETDDETDGTIPFDTQISSVIVSGYDENGLNVSSTMIASTVLDAPNDLVKIRLNYPGSTGRYKLTMKLSLNDGSTWEKDYNSIDVVDECHDDFFDNSFIKLQATSDQNAYRFIFEPATTERGKGKIPYDTEISSAKVSGYFEDGTDVTNDLITNKNEFPQDDAIIMKLKYPGVLGRYRLRFFLTLDDGSVWIKDYNRIEVIDI